MRTPESHHETRFTAQEKSNDVPELVVAPSESAENEDGPERYQTREDLEKALNEAKKSEAHLRKIIDTIPTLAWCNLPTGAMPGVDPSMIPSPLLNARARRSHSAIIASSSANISGSVTVRANSRIRAASARNFPAVAMMPSYSGERCLRRSV